MHLSSEVLVSLFPSLDAGLVRELAAENPSDVAIKSLLLLCKGHWLQAIATEATERRPLLVILRGLPGSGKSTLAQAIRICCGEEDAAVVSADDFFLDAEGKYVFAPSLLEKAHQWSQTKARTAMKSGKKVVIIDNTNLQAWEMLPYCKLGAEAGYCILFLEPVTSWKHDPVILAKKTSHGVPFDKIKQMKWRMEDKLTSDNVCAKLPAASKPKSTSLETLLKNLELTEMEPKSEILSKKGYSAVTNGEVLNRSEDFQSLLQCFPDRSVDDVYLPYLKNGANLERTMNTILDEQHNSPSTDDTQIEFDMLLDADLASQLEGNFGSVRGKHNFPGALSFKIPRNIAQLLHYYWQKEMQEKLTEEVVARIVKAEKRVDETPRMPSAQKVAAAAGSSSPEPKFADYVDEEKPSKPVSREEVLALRERRAAVYQKAAAAFKAKQGGVAAYYSEEGRALTEKIDLHESNLRYQAFVEANKGKNNLTFDLHGLTVPEAIENLEWFIEEKYESLRYSQQERVRLEIITGRGSKGKAKIKPAVIAFLKKSDLNFSEANPGSLELLLKKK